MVKADYWNVNDQEVVAKTGKPLAHWMKALKAFDAKNKKPAEAVRFLQEEHSVPRYWARTLATRYLKESES